MKNKKLWVFLVMCMTAVSMTACSSSFRIGNEEYMEQFEEDKNTKDEGQFTTSNAVIKGYFEALQSGKKSEINKCFPKGSTNDNSTEGDLDTIVFDIDNIDIDSENLDIDELDEDKVKAFDIESAKQATVLVPMTQTIEGVEYQVEETYTIITCCIDGNWYIYNVESEGAVVVGQEGNTENGENVLPGESSDYNYSKDWCTIGQSSDKVIIDYTSGVSNTYKLSDKGTFEDLCNWVDYATTDYDTTILKHVFSLYFGASDYYEQMEAQATEDQRDYLIASLVSLAWTIDDMDGDTYKATVYTDNQYKYYFTVNSTSLGEFELAWDTNTNQLYLVNGTTETKYDNGTFDNNRLATFMVAVNEALNGTPVDGASSSNGTVDNNTGNNVTTTSNTSAVDELDEYSYINYSEASEIVSKVESYYNSTIVSIEDCSYSPSEAANITLANGKTCKYYASSSDMKSVYDTSDSYETIWSLYR